jgi:diamine N-acetyltransferase
MIIREAETTDFEQIFELFREFSEYQGLPERMKNNPGRMREEKDYFHCFVAETNDKQIIGYATWFFTYYTWSGKGMYMDDLYVRPGYRGQGIGTRLLNSVVALAKEHHCHKLRWQVSHWNREAIAFYVKMGAEIDDIEKNCDLDLEK